ncbi:MAG: hypothetical protein ACLFNZ_09180 [Spirochaetaceae bacterium]
MRKKRTPIGKFLVSRGLLSIEEEKEVAAEQSLLKEEDYEAFGRIAVRKGFLSEKVVKDAIRERSRQEREG